MVAPHTLSGQFTSSLQLLPYTVDVTGEGYEMHRSLMILGLVVVIVMLAGCQSTQPAHERLEATHDMLIAKAE